MPNSNALDVNLQAMVNDFVRRIVSAVENATTQRVQSAVVNAIASATGASIAFPRRRGRPPKNAIAAPAVVLAARPRRKLPKQLCPVPGCPNPAAPVFGMVCAKHKGVPKAKIKQYRAQRRAAKERAKAKAA